MICALCPYKEECDLLAEDAHNNPEFYDYDICLWQEHLDEQAALNNGGSIAQ